jgi:hypothetical protein
VDRGFRFFVGDANGADRAIQEHLAKRGYDRVVIYSVTGILRNNVGHWEVRSVDAPRGARGFEFYAAKDSQMARDASYGLMVWDGRSRGTLENVRNLLSQGKPVAVYLGPLRRFVSLRSPTDLSKLGLATGLGSCDRHDFPFGDSASASQQAAAADDRGPSPPARPRQARNRVARTRSPS